MVFFVGPLVHVMFLGLYSETALRIFLIFCMKVEDKRAHCLSKIAFLKRILISDYRGLSVQNRWFFYFFALFWTLLLNCPKDLPNFLHDHRGQQGPLFEQNCFSGKIRNPGLQGIKCPRWFFLLLWTFHFRFEPLTRADVPIATWQTIQDSGNLSWSVDLI